MPCHVIDLHSNALENKTTFRIAFLTLGPIGWIVSCVGAGGRGCSVHCGTFSSLPGLYPLDPCSGSLIATMENILAHCQMSLEGAAS